MKVSRTRAIALAVHLFELEVEMIGNDSKGHFIANDWLNKFGDNSLQYENKLTSDKNNPFNAEAIKKIADEIQADFASEFWSIGSCDEGLYNYMMPTQYGGYITDALEKQLAILMGVGVQQEMILV